MRILSTRIHGMLDYLIAPLLVALPFIVGFNDRGPMQWTMIVAGAGAGLYTLFTDFETGLVRVLPMSVHLWLDALAGLALAVSPWVLGFENRVWVPHVVAGLGEIMVAVVTDTVPSYERRRAG